MGKLLLKSILQLQLVFQFQDQLLSRLLSNARSFGNGFCIIR